MGRAKVGEAEVEKAKLHLLYIDVWRAGSQFCTRQACSRRYPMSEKAPVWGVWYRQGISWLGATKKRA